MPKNKDLQNMLTSFEKEVGHIKEWEIERINNLKAVNTNESQSKGGKVGGPIGGKISKDNKLGFHSMSKEQRSEIGKKVGKEIGPRSQREKFGIFGLTEEEKLNVAKYAAQQSIKSPNHVNNKRLTCPHCNKEGGYTAMKRHHMDRCKYKE
jgi:hypothetical protein